MNNLIETTGITLPAQELDQISRVYQAAFAGPPWFEVSKCVSQEPEIRCRGGFSPQKIGEFCTKCAKMVVEEAYPLTGLKFSLADRLEHQGARLYREYARNGNLLLAALFWEDRPIDLAYKKYPDVPIMQNWLKSLLPDEPLIWLDEIFANKELRSKGNLWNFPNLISEVFVRSKCSRLAFRTINEGLLAKSAKSFDNCRILSPGEIPDQRYFVIIEKGNRDE